jgi:mycothiol synthase
VTSPLVALVETDAAAAGTLLEPFDEQTSLDVAAGRRRLFAVRATPAQTVVGSAVLGQGALDLHIAPEFGARGLGGDAAAQLLERAGGGPLTAWSHEDHPAARALAARFGFRAARMLLQLRRELQPVPGPRGGPDTGAGSEPPSGAVLTAFRPGADEAEWLALNARVFAWHPEQGGTTQADLAQRMAEPWFDADDFLLARDDRGTMIGYCWLKVEDAASAEGRSGEIYVIGVAPEAAGHGLGRVLMEAGLDRLLRRGCTSAELYVEGDNERGIRLYRSLGFAEARVHVQYLRA